MCNLYASNARSSCLSQTSCKRQLHIIRDTTLSICLYIAACSRGLNLPLDLTVRLSSAGRESFQIAVRTTKPRGTVNGAWNQDERLDISALIWVCDVTRHCRSERVSDWEIFRFCSVQNQDTGLTCPVGSSWLDSHFKNLQICSHVQKKKLFFHPVWQFIRFLWLKCLWRTKTKSARQVMSICFPVIRKYMYVIQSHWPIYAKAPEQWKKTSFQPKTVLVHPLNREILSNSSRNDTRCIFSNTKPNLPWCQISGWQWKHEPIPCPMK